jgi:RNA polymerase-interacting CarD/CdnL/TRCF family regulator
MDFKVHDRVIHHAFGIGEIIQLDEKEVSGRTAKYYIVQLNDMLLWVPMNEAGEGSLRFVTPRSEFKSLFEILQSQAEDLPQDRLARKTQLLERLKDGKLDSICLVIRDIHHFGRSKRLSDYDSIILERAKNFLLNEWAVALAIPIRQAEQELRDMLKG